MSKELTTKNTASLSQRFTAMVLKEFETSVGELSVTEHQRDLIQGYFIGIDEALRTAEANRISRNKWAKDPNHLPYIWQNINMNKLAIDVKHYSKMGLDIRQPNFINPIPYKNGNKYDLTWIEGYSAKIFKAEKYALNKPKNVVIELVHKNDTFEVYKKDRDNEVENYIFQINPFNRGDVVGGFGYIEYDDEKENRLIIMTLEQMMKRKPKYASVEFWGGEKKGKGGTEQVEGWLDEMLYKTLVHYVFHSRHIPLDPKKIDDAYLHAKVEEVRATEYQSLSEADEYANVVEIDTTPNIEAVEINELTGEIVDETTETTETAEEVEVLEADDLP